jgi:hypothetical protein
MKWGVRKASEHPVSEDHVNAEAAKAHAKKNGGIAALSNKELQDVITRKNLEKQYNELNGAGNKFDKGHKHIMRVLKGVKTGIDTINTVESAGKAIKKGIGVAKTIGQTVGAV